MSYTQFIFTFPFPFLVILVTPAAFPIAMSTDCESSFSLVSSFKVFPVWSFDDSAWKGLLK